MKNIDINTKQPVAVAFAPNGGKLQGLLDGLDCREFRISKALEPDEMLEAKRQKYRHLGAFLIDITSADFGLEDCIDCIDPAFRDAGGPVIVIVDGEEGYSEEALYAQGASKIVDAQLGQRALRLVISIEIEEFERICLLRTELQKRSSAIGQIVQGQFRFKTRREAQNLATMLSMTCPNPMPIAIGLTELFINGVEHGCLGIGHNEKGRLIEEGVLAEEIERRRAMPEFCDRFVTVQFEREPNRLRFEIFDGGDGFDFQSFIEDSEGHSKKHGRGIMMANGCFEELTYRGNGNEVHAVHYFGKRS
jgi:hypothetical protein